MRTFTKVAICVAGVTVAAAGAVLVRELMVRRLAGLAIKRATPEQIKRGNGRNKISGAKRDDAEVTRRREMSDILAASEHETVEITAFDGINLVGHFFRAENQKRIVIAMHGWRSKWSNDFAPITEFFLNSGCSVLYPEQRGQNASGGDCMGFGVIERFDCLEWAKYIANREGMDVPIYLYGVSMGAATVMMASELELPDSVAGIITDCGYTSPQAIWKHVTQNNMHVPYAIVASRVDKEYKRLTGYECDATCTGALSRTRIPVLFIHGTEDKFVPISMTYENYTACASEKELLIIPGAPHVRSYTVDKDRYERKISEFFAKYDK